MTKIGADAFYGCDSLTSITIPNSVTEIGNNAFRDCSSLTHITIPNSVTEIRDDAFSDCSSLTHITIPKSVTKIGAQAFYDCDSLKTVNYRGTKEQWKSISIDWSSNILGQNNDKLRRATINYNYTGK